MDYIDSYIYVNYDDTSLNHIDNELSQYYILQFYGNYKEKSHLSVTGYILYTPQMKQIFTKSVCLTKYNSSYNAGYYGLILGLEKAIEYENITRLIIEGDNINIIHDLNNCTHCSDDYNKVKYLEKQFKHIIYRHFI